ncbi:hypothetical protein [Cupriavidus taiwanensis]
MLRRFPRTRQHGAVARKACKPVRPPQRRNYHAAHRVRRSERAAAFAARERSLRCGKSAGTAVVRPVRRMAMERDGWFWRRWRCHPVRMALGLFIVAAGAASMLARLLPPAV